MRPSASIAIVGVAACIAVYSLSALDSAPHQSAYTIISPEEHKFMEYIVRNGKTYATKEEYEFRFL